MCQNTTKNRGCGSNAYNVFSRFLGENSVEHGGVFLELFLLPTLGLGAYLISHISYHFLIQYLILNTNCISLCLTLSHNERKIHFFLKKV